MITVENLVKLNACTRGIVQFIKTPVLLNLENNCEIECEDKQLVYDLQWAILKQLLKINKLCNTLPDGNIETWEYNSEGNLTSHKYPDGRIETWEYNSEGKLTSYKYPDGNIETWEYNSEGKLVNINSDKYCTYTGNIKITK